MKSISGRLRRVVRGVVGGGAPPVKQQQGSAGTRASVPQPDVDFAMIVGAQRSGTTWLQLLCAAHPKIAGSEELHLFSRYLGHLIASYYNDLRHYAEAGRSQGLPTLLSTDEFDDAVRQFAMTVLEKLLKGKPGAALAIEKTPDHVLHLHYIRHLFPKAKIIHVIRDPRDVVVSQLAAGASWGEDWAPKDAAEAAARWVEWVSTGRRYASDGYLEVRYETLIEDGPRELARVYNFLGHPLPADQVERIYQQFTMANIKSGKAPNVLVILRETVVSGSVALAGAAMPTRPAGRKPPEGFYRKGKAGGWRESLAEADVRTIQRIAGPLMRELGYAHAEFPPALEPAAASA
ncbi:MAG TPA: sulfotransferase [Tepidisphaeraceae bacterium]|nr:sulfotransferase [Tepidisphaeraceae bacterium]